MADTTSSSEQNFGALVPSGSVGGGHEWHPVFHASNQVVLYNPTSHALTISHAPPSTDYRLPDRRRPPCPYCKQALPDDFMPDATQDRGAEVHDHLSSGDTDPAYLSRASDYFRLLAIANESSRPPTPSPSVAVDDGRGQRTAFPAETLAEGYFKAFFQEEYKLGMGANGSVFLCQHMLNGNPLGHFAVKKIAVGESHSYLLKILREVRLLERLHHPNIITYHHAWLETCQFSQFGPKVPTLYVLMQWAEGGSLDDFIDVRLGRRAQHIHVDPIAPFAFGHATSASSVSGDTHLSFNEPHITTTNDSTPSTPITPGGWQFQSRSARIRAFRAFQRAPPEEKERMRKEMEAARSRGKHDRTSWKAVHLLSAEEVKSIFKDVVEGLAFLHNKSILHLDLKPGNVLLTWDEGRLIPRAMLSDFGTSRDMIHNSRIRSGNTGTLEYSSPESLPSPLTGRLHQVDSKADMWSLGMILHKLLFFKLPYRHAAEGDASGEPVSSGVDEREKMDRLEKEILSYPGFKSTPALMTMFEGRRLPKSFLMLLEGLLNVVPAKRPSCERVLNAILEGKLDPLKDDYFSTNGLSSLIPIIKRRSSPESLTEIQRNLPDSLASSSRYESAEVQTGSVVDGDALRTPRSSDPSFAGRLEAEKSLNIGPPLLALPEQPQERSARPGDLSASIERLKMTLRLRMPGNLGVRIIKSCILVTKVSTLSSACLVSSAPPRPYIVFVLLFAAVLDTVLEGLVVSVILGLFHVGLIMSCWTGMLGSSCCAS